LKVYGTMIAQNEGDIIEEVLEFLGELDLFERIFFFDLGSEDDTFEKARHFRDLIGEPQLIRAPYSNPLRMELLLRNRHLYRDGHWLAIVDADEFYEEDPREALERADQEGADSVLTFQADFFLTHEDLVSPSPARHVRDRLHNYLIDWTEIRFFKYLPQRPQGPLGSLVPCRQKFLNRHYRYRSPEQIQTRILTRVANRRATADIPGREPWTQVFSERWQDYIVPRELLHQVDAGGLKFGLPPGTCGEQFANHPFSQLALDLEKEHAAMAMLPPVIRAVPRRQEATETPILRELGVARAQAGAPFNAQPDGRSALWVRCENAQPGTVVLFGGTCLPTTWGGPELLTALVPVELYARPGRYPVRLVYAGCESDAFDFIVEE